MADMAYHLSFVLNALLAVSVYFVVRASVKARRLGATRARTIYSVAVVAGGLLSGLVLFPAMVGSARLLGFAVSYGHGEMILAAVVFNVFLSLVLLVLGGILLDWRPVDWRSWREAERSAKGGGNDHVRKW